MSVLFETERLIFRDWQPADFEPFHAICSDERVMEFVGDGQPWSRDTTLKFIERAIEMSRNLGFCQWPVISKSDSVLIGYCGFVKSGDRAEIGWRLARPYWGQGLATEAARCALKYGFEVLGFGNVFATVQALNRPSIRIAEKLGMKPESSFHRDGKHRTVYSVNRRGDAADPGTSSKYARPQSRRRP